MLEVFDVLNKQVKFVSFIEESTDVNDRHIKSKFDLFQEGSTTVLHLFQNIVQVLSKTVVSILLVTENGIEELEIIYGDFYQMHFSLLEALTHRSKDLQGKNLYVIDSDYLYEDDGPFFFIAEDESKLDDIIRYIYEKTTSWGENMNYIPIDEKVLSTFKGTNVSHLRKFSFQNAHKTEIFIALMRVAGYFEI